MARVLLVEDEPAICLMLSDAVADEGHQVRDAITCEEAEAALADLHGELDLLVTDINVGARGWGLGFAARARELNPRLRVIYITGDSERRIAEEGVDGGLALP